MQALKTQLMLKGIITLKDWNLWKEDIVFDFIEDNYGIPLGINKRDVDQCVCKSKRQKNRKFF